MKKLALTLLILTTNYHASIFAMGTQSTETPQSTQNDVPQCSICLEEIKQEEKSNILPCDHSFHAKCIDAWLKENNSCPNCRRKRNQQVKSENYGTFNAETVVHIPHENRNNIARAGCCQTSFLLILVCAWGLGGAIVMITLPFWSTLFLGRKT